MIKIGVLVGGNSNERTISYKSSSNIINELINIGYKVEIIDPIDNDFLEKIKRNDFFFNLIHGFYGEDGKIQSLLELLNKNFTFSGIETANLTFDKYYFYKIFENQILFPKTLLVKKLNFLNNQYPVILKPRRGGSSIDVFIVHNEKEFIDKSKYLFDKYKEFLIQEYIQGKEIAISLLEIDNNFKLLPILELIPKNEFYDYEAKYTLGKTDFNILNSLEENLKNQINDIVDIITTNLSFRDMLRIDAIIKNNNVYVLETNIIPGLTDLSDLPQSAQAVNIDFKKLVKIFLDNHNIKY